MVMWENTKLYEAVETGDVDKVRYLLESGANVNYTNYGGQTPLHLAASQGYYEVAALLLLYEADVNVVDLTGWTALHAAADAGHCEVATLLVSYGANVKAANKYEWTPLHYAACHGHIEVASLLLSNGANIDVTDDNGSTPLMYAAYYNHLEVAALLLSEGADRDTANKYEWTPLHEAERQGHLEMAQLLHASKKANPQSYSDEEDRWDVQPYLSSKQDDVAFDNIFQPTKETFFSLISCLDPAHTRSAEALCTFQLQLASVITNVHEMKLFYTLFRATLAHGLIEDVTQAKQILQTALEMTATSSREDAEVAIFKLILKKCHGDAMIDELTLNMLDRTAENKNTEHQPFIKEMKDAIMQNAQGIFRLHLSVQSLKENILILDKNIRSVNSTVEKMKSAARFKLKMDATLGMVKAVIGAVSFGMGGCIVDTFQSVMGHIVDFGDVAHIAEVATALGGEYADVMKNSLQNGIESATESLGESMESFADSVAESIVEKRIEEACNKGDPLFILGFISVATNGNVLPNLQTITKQGVPVNSAVVHNNTTQCIFPGAILSEDDEERLEVHATIKYGDLEELKLLLQLQEHVHSMNERDSEGRTAADLAAMTGQTELLAILHRKGGVHCVGKKARMKLVAKNREADSSVYLAWAEKQCI